MSWEGNPLKSKGMRAGNGFPVSLLTAECCTSNCYKDWAWSAPSGQGSFPASTLELPTLHPILGHKCP